MSVFESVTRIATYYNSMNIPNFITILRVIAIPFFIVALSYQYNGIALIIFVGCGLTDGLDGFIARTFHQRTQIGAFLDPLADKLLLTSSFITLAFLKLPNKIPFWLTVTAISRDIIISIGVAVLFMLGTKFQIAPTWVGKLTTFFQVTLIIVVLFYNYKNSYHPEIILPLCWITFVVSVASGLGYVYQGIQLLNDHAS
jgi:cardiolipin synthase